MQVFAAVLELKYIKLIFQECCLIMFKSSKMVGKNGICVPLESPTADEVEDR